jgi:ferredoxin
VEVAAIPLPGAQVNHPILLVLAFFVLGATVAFWFATRHRADWKEPVGAGPSVTINVDPVKCARFGYCEHEAPYAFQLRGEGRLTYSDQVPVEELDPVIRAAEVCPARAISLGRMPRGY